MEFTIGVDIGGTNTRFGAVDRDGNVLIEDHFSTALHHDPAEFTRALTAGIRQCATELDDHTMHGVGIGAPNANYHRGTVEHPPNLLWKGVTPLADMVRHDLDRPVWITNDANAAAIGEKLYGGGKDLEDFLVVTLGTGVGSGFISAGNVLYGATGFAGELGHVIMDENGRQCGCGRRGCLETYASVTGFVQTAKNLLAGDRESALRHVPIDDLTGKDICDAARTGDALALQVYQQTADVLGLALANAAAITSPAAIFLFGGLADSGDLILQPTKRAMEAKLLPILLGTVELRLSGLLDRNAAILGAAALAWQEWESMQDHV